MNLDQLKNEVRDLTTQEQLQLISHLVELRREREPDYAKEMAKRIDDRSRENWLTIDELEERLDRAPN